MSARERLRTVARSIRWFMRGIVQEDAYERYVAHQQRVHPGCPVMSEKEFWRDRTDNTPVKTRCC